MNKAKQLSTAITSTYRIKPDFGGVFPAGTPFPNNEPDRQQPRAHQIRSAQNYILAPRQEIDGLTPFAILDFVAKSTDLIQIAENLLLNQISGRRWDILPADPEDKGKYEAEQKVLKEFFKHPDRERTYSQWIRKALKNITRYDAFTLYKRKNKRGGLYGLNIVDGSTIKIVVDSNGNKPIPPYPSYQQIIYGTVRGSWDSKELIYAPMSEDLKGNYGISPVERILQATMKYLRKQNFDYAYYKEGAFPDGGLYAVRPNDQSQWTAEDIVLFQENWDYRMADHTKRQSLTFVPDGQLHRTKEYKWDTLQEEWFGRIVCTTMGIDFQTFSKQINRATAEVDDRKQTDVGLKPYIKHIEDILTDIIQVDFGFEALAFKIIDEKLEDQDAKVNKNDTYLKNGIYNRNEIRREEGKEPIEGGDVYTVQVGNAVIPLNNIEKVITIGNKEDGVDSNAPNNVKGAKLEAKDVEMDASNRPVLTDNKKDNKETAKKKEVQKALSHYKNFLIKRFKEGRSLKGYSNESLSEDFIVKVESSDIQNIGNIIEIFKAEEDKEELEVFLIALVSYFENLKSKFISYIETPYKSANLEAVLSFPLSDKEKLKADLKEYLTNSFNKGQKDGFIELNKLLKQSGKESVDIDAEVKNISEYVDSLVNQLEKSTQGMLTALFASSLEKGLGWESFKSDLENAYPFSANRSRIIAENEGLKQYNDGATIIWEKSKMIDKVYVYDGDGCVTCSELNGTIQTLEWARQNPVQHPNCVRNFTPLL
jgi:phage portal protein BeeE